MPQLFNACEYLLDRRLAAGDGPRTALTGAAGDVSYAALHDQVRRTAASLRTLGLQPEQRVLMLMADSPQFVVVYLAAMRMGAIPVPVSTMLKADGVAELLQDSRARFLAVTREFAATAVAAAAAAPELTGMLADEASGRPARSRCTCSATLAAGPADDAVYPTTADSPAFWLYTSGTTGQPKAAMHRHGAIQVVCETYGRPGARDPPAATGACPPPRPSSPTAWATRCCSRCRSAPPPSWCPPRPGPDLIADAAQKYGATLFFAGPTFFANMLAGRAGRGRAGRGAAGRLGGGGAARVAVRSGGPRTSAWTSWTASA